MVAGKRSSLRTCTEHVLFLLPARLHIQKKCLFFSKERSDIRVESVPIHTTTQQIHLLPLCVC